MTTTNLHARGTDSWLTPLSVIKALGKFDLDPCCPPVMPWRTARRMVCQPQDGLGVKWSGRVWLNPPYSDVAPWTDKLIEHGRGTALVSCKSFDSRWAQRLLSSSSGVLILSGRLLFHYPDGTASTGKWLSNALVAVGPEDAKQLRACKLPGVVVKRVS